MVILSTNNAILDFHRCFHHRRRMVVDVGLEKQEKEYAGFWIRFGAYLIDGIILSIPLAIFMIIFSLIFIGEIVFLNPTSSQFEAELSGPKVVSFLATYFIFCLVALFGSMAYFAGFQSSKMQATPGKLLFGLKVVDIQGNRITFWRGLGRYFAMILSGIFYIGYIIAAFTEKKQALHDMIAGTYVIKAK